MDSALLKNFVSPPLVPSVQGDTYGYVYFIRGRATRRIKIGSTSRLHQRLTDLQNSNSDRLDLLASIEATDARFLEVSLHLRFGKYREHGEWFRPGRDLTAYLDSLKNPPDVDFYIDDFEAYRHPATVFERLPLIGLREAVLAEAVAKARSEGGK